MRSHETRDPVSLSIAVPGLLVQTPLHPPRAMSLTNDSKHEGRNDRESPAAHNRDVANSINYYCNYPYAQGFAVMLSGQWGSGKTHFIKQLMPNLGKDRDSNAHRPLYVSLYGVESPSEISDQLFQQMHPLLASKPSRFIGAILQGAAKAAVKIDLTNAVHASGVLPDLKVSNLMKGAKGRIIIFDDFERALMNPAAILGFLNPMVEHENCKIIIVADEDQIAEKEEYLNRKEKTVGRTFELLADPQAAFDDFLTEIGDDDARKFFRCWQEDILKVFSDSTYNNLRHLKHFLWDFERLWKVLTVKQRQHEVAMRELLGMIGVATIELRSGSMPPNIFRRADNVHNVRVRSENPEGDALAADAIFKKYPSVSFDSTLLEPEVIVELVLKGRLPISRITRQLNEHPYFNKRNNLPSWRALWLSADIPRDDHPAIISSFETDFEARRFKQEPEIYHVIGLSIVLSEAGCAGWQAEELIGKVQSYIADVYGHTEPTPDDMASSNDSDYSGSYGLAYSYQDDPRFEELAAFHRQERAAWRKRAYPAVAKRLVGMIDSDSEAFLRDVCFTSGGSARYARIGILQHIPAEEFVRTLLAASIEHAKRVMMALSIRYDQVTVCPELEEEMPWLADVHRLVTDGLINLPPLSRIHFKGRAEEYLGKTLRGARELLASKRGSVISADW